MTRADRRSGVKHDAGKRRFDLLPWRAVAQVADVLAFGAREYGDGNWRRVPDYRRRYFAALMRHVVAWYGGERLDPESGMNHMAHAACCALFMLARDTRAARRAKR